MAIDYAELATTADEALVDAGRSAHYVRRAVGTEVYDPTTLTVTGASAVVASVVVADFDYETKPGGRFVATDAGGSLVETGDRQVLMSAKTAAGALITWEPSQGDTIVLGDGNTWRVVRLEQKIAPAGTNVMFVLQTRRGAPNPNG